MPAKEGIQSGADINDFKELDSRFRGNDSVFPITTQSQCGGKATVSLCQRTPALGRKPFMKLRPFMVYGVPKGHEELR
jgi:hypothetical protein